MPGIRRGTEDHKGVGVISSTTTEENKQVYYCQNCFDVGVYSVLGERVYLVDENDAASNKFTVMEQQQKDSHNWRQCYKCGVIVPVYELKKQGKLSDFADVASDNPFEFGRGTIIAVGETRKFDKTGKRQHKRKVKQDLSNIKEADLRSEIAKGARLISYQSSD